MKLRFLGFILVFILFLTPWVFAAVEKVVVKNIEFQKDGENIFARIIVELYTDGVGEAYLQATAQYGGKEYATDPLRMQSTFPYQVFTFLLSNKDFRLINLAEGIQEELPTFVEDKGVTVYIYGKKITRWEDYPTEDVKRDLAKYGYALREILAKGTKTLQERKK
ncbi:MAG: hypothetical protein ACUVQZ_04870 [Candidatus Caldatribacteriaceae bacterium]